MTAKEKAKELVDKYLNAAFNCKKCDMPYCDIKCTRLVEMESKECALIAVDEIINTNALSEMLDYGIDKTNLFYWEQVKQFIEEI